MRSTGLLLLILATPAPAAELTPECRARAALALAAAPSADCCRAKAALALAHRPAAARRPCNCPDTGRCKCLPGQCGCCTGDLPGAAEQKTKAEKLGLPLVVYHGVAGHCLDGCLSASTSLPPTDPARPVAVWVRAGAAWRVYARLAADADRDELKAAVSEAAAWAKQARPVAAPAVARTAPLVTYPACPTGRCR